MSNGGWKNYLCPQNNLLVGSGVEKNPIPLAKNFTMGAVRNFFILCPDDIEKPLSESSKWAL